MPSLWIAAADANGPESQACPLAHIGRLGPDHNRADQAGRRNISTERPAQRRRSTRPLLGPQFPRRRASTTGNAPATRPRRAVLAVVGQPGTWRPSILEGVQAPHVRCRSSGGRASCERVPRLVDLLRRKIRVEDGAFVFAELEQDFIRPIHQHLRCGASYQV